MIFSEMLWKTLMTNSSSKRVWGSAISSPVGGLGDEVPKDFGQNAMQMQENSSLLNIFTFTDSLKWFCS